MKLSNVSSDDILLLEIMADKMGRYTLDGVAIQKKLRESRDEVRARSNDPSFGVRAEIATILKGCIGDPRIKEDLQHLLSLTV